MVSFHCHILHTKGIGGKLLHSPAATLPFLWLHISTLYQSMNDLQQKSFYVFHALGPV